MLFKLYVIPIIIFCSGLYTNPTSSSFGSIKRIQRVFTRRLYMPLLLYQTMTLDLIYSDFAVSLMLEDQLKTLEKIVHYQMKSKYFRPSYSARKENLILIHSINTSLYRNSFFHRVLELWNSHLSSKKLAKT